MDLSDDNWMPPSGDYLCQISGVLTGNGKKNPQAIWIKPQFTIVDEGDLQSKTFVDFYYVEPGISEPTMGVKNLCRLATCIAGHDVTDPAMAFQIIKDAEGELLNLQVYSQTSQKNGKTYTNIRFLSKVASTES
jgi:hypothetical protein